ncbi:MAG: aspartate aminotransferase family protein [Candidatus Korarchaeum sp.]|nr:aspartate aminotransferase family protein [Candidatus Korarchaeum sp.]MDW8036002.1 aspartate aminotransferase family protein [Candidatus Korarchaeum sp.]
MSRLSRRDVIELANSYMMTNVARWWEDDPIVIESGRGAVLRDMDGREYIDLHSMHAVASQGYSHPKIVQAIKEQLERIFVVATDFYNEPQSLLAKKLAEITPAKLKRSFFVNSGAEAVETATILAKRYTGKPGIIALWMAFHGRTHMPRTLTGFSRYKRGIGPFPYGVLHIPNYYCYRCPIGQEYPSCNLQCARMLDDALKYAAPEDVAAFIAEPIQGTAGNIVPPDDYFKTVKNILDQYGILFIADEVITGLGRTGKLFAVEHFGIEPDIMTLAKALGGGFPVACAIASEEIGTSFKPLDHYSTYGGNPLAMTAALAAIEVIEEGRLVDKSARDGEYMLKRLKELMDRHEIIGEVSGKGLMIGMELVKDKKTKEPAIEETVKFRAELRRRGVIIGPPGWTGSRVRINPPLVITREQIDRAVDAIDESLSAIMKN